MPDWFFCIGMGLLTFALMVSCFSVVAKATSTPVPKTALYIGGGFCVAMTAFFLVVSAFHVGHRLFGWMLTK